MAHILKARVAETSTSTGTGDFTLSGAVTAHKTFASRMSVADTTEYVIYAVDGSGVPTGEWEEGTGTYSAANTLTRTTVAESSNSDTAVNFGAGSKVVIMTPLASRVGALIQGGAAGDVLLKTGTGDFAWGWSSLTDSVRATVLTGLSTATATVVNATHTVLEAIGFLQKQVSDNATAITDKQDALVSGTNIKTVNSTSLLGSGDISVTADLTAPGPIGGTTPSTVAATAVTATSVTAAGGTVTASTPVINCTQTWNNAAVSFTGRLTNITNTASASTSLIEDWQVGAATAVSIRKDKKLFVGGNPNVATDNWIEISQSGIITGRGASAGYQQFDIRGVTNGYGVGIGQSSLGLLVQNTKTWLPADGLLMWSDSNGNPNSSGTTALGRSSSGVLEVNSGTTGTYRDIKLRNHIGTGGNVTGMAAKTADYTLTLNDHAATFDATAAARTATLPALSTVTAGQEYIAIKIDSSGNSVTLDGNASETINGAASISTTTQWVALRVKANADKSAWVTF